MATDKAPWGPDGLHSYPGYPYGVQEEWRPNEPFEAYLELEGMHRGRSSAQFLWVNQDTGEKLPMFMADMLDLVKHGAVIDGVAFGRWIVRKRGQNYGIAVYYGE